MEQFDKKKHILKLIKDNKEGVSIDTILNFLDYINKVRYEKDEIEKVLKQLITEKKIFFRNDLYL